MCMNNQQDLVVEWNLTYQCNLNCVHCSVTKTRSIKDTLTLSDFEEAIEKLSPYRCKIHINPSSGEPTVKKDFVRIYNLMAQNSNSIKMTTNGILLSKIVDDLNLRNLSTIIVSVDGGSQEVHDKIRGKNTYEKTCQSLEALYRKKEEESLSFSIQVNYVLNRLNCSSLMEVITLLDTYDIGLLNVLHAELSEGHAKDNADVLYLPYEECIQHIGKALHSLRKTNKKRAEQGKRPILLRPESFAAKWLHRLATMYGIKHLLLKRRSTCNVLTKKFIYVDPQGYAFPCFFFTRKELQQEMVNRYSMATTPNITEDTVEGILTSDFFETARTLIKEFQHFDNMQCSQCKLFDACSVCPVYAALWGVENECF